MNLTFGSTFQLIHPPKLETKRAEFCALQGLLPFQYPDDVRFSFSPFGTVKDKVTPGKPLDTRYRVGLTGITPKGDALIINAYQNLGMRLGYHFKVSKQQPRQFINTNTTAPNISTWV
jgi:hypothetical protein